MATAGNIKFMVGNALKGFSVYVAVVGEDTMTNDFFTDFKFFIGVFARKKNDSAKYFDTQ